MAVLSPRMPIDCDKLTAMLLSEDNGWILITVTVIFTATVCQCTCIYILWFSFHVTFPLQYCNCNQNNLQSIFYLCGVAYSLLSSV